MKKIIILILIFICTSRVYAEDIFDLNSTEYLSNDLYLKALELENRYKDLIKVNEYGKSYDDKPLFAIILTANNKQTLANPEFKVIKQHYLVEAGTHAKESLNPLLVLNQVELYCKDYYNEETIKSFDMHIILDKAVIHFLPLTNPDGYDLVKIGQKSVQPKNLEVLKNIKDKNYSKYKAGITGVDHNRNYPSRYLDLETEKWINLWNENTTEWSAKVPCGSYFYGESPSTEPEVIAIEKYIKKYDFRNYISFHSRGDIIYWNQYYFDEIYNKRSYSLAKRISKVNGYSLGNKNKPTGSGYMSDYTTQETLKPILVVETMKMNEIVNLDLYKYAYEKNKTVPLHAVIEGLTIGYHKYRLYDENGIYIRDFENRKYAKALKLKGTIIEGVGVPVFQIKN